MSPVTGRHTDHPGTAVLEKWPCVGTRSGCWGSYFTWRPVLCHSIWIGLLMKPGNTRHRWLSSDPHHSPPPRGRTEWPQWVAHQPNAASAHACVSLHVRDTLRGPPPLPIIIHNRGCQVFRAEKSRRAGVAGGGGCLVHTWLFSRWGNL